MLLSTSKTKPSQRFVLSASLIVVLFQVFQISFMTRIYKFQVLHVWFSSFFLMLDNFVEKIFQRSLRRIKEW